MANDAAGGGKPPHMAGKVIIPDMSAAQQGQMQNVQTMGEVSQDAADALQQIISSQQEVFAKSIEGLQASIKQNASIAGFAPPVLNLQNIEGIVSHFSETANKMTETTNMSYEKLSQSVTETMAKIEETAKKFSGG